MNPDILSEKPLESRFEIKKDGMKLNQKKSMWLIGKG